MVIATRPLALLSTQISYQFEHNKAIVFPRGYNRLLGPRLVLFFVCYVYFLTFIHVRLLSLIFIICIALTYLLKKLPWILYLT